MVETARDAVDARPGVLDRDIEALERGRASLDLSRWRIVEVRGSDAVRWLDDLVTNGMGHLAEGVARRTLFLDRAGHVRADVAAVLHAGCVYLMQDPLQLRPIDGLLSPYVLSSDVEIRDRSGRTAVAAVPGDEGPRTLLDLHGAAVELRPDTATPRAAVPPAASSAAHDAWRIRNGVARFGVDFDERSIPAEAGLERFVDTSKGCFLGQESVARVRNLGRPPWTVAALEGDTADPAAIRPGEPVVDAGGTEVGAITSAAVDGPRRVRLIARMRTPALDGELRTPAGAPLRRY